MRSAPSLPSQNPPARRGRFVVGPRQWGRTRTIGAAAAAALAVVASVLVFVDRTEQPANAAPGNPGVPSAPVELFHEDFENGLADGPPGQRVLLAAYVGAGGEQYTADPFWLNAADCNGMVLTGTTDDTAITSDGCSPGAGHLATIRGLATVLGELNGSADQLANHAVSAYTFGVSGAGGQVEFRTLADIPLVSAGRYLAFSAAVASSCASADAQLQFFLDDGGTELSTTSAPLNPCAAGAGQAPVFNPSLTGGIPNTTDWRMARVTSDAPVLFTGTELGIVMRNATGASSGNDHSFDDIRVLDVTPQLDQQFVPAVAPAGLPTTLRYTITNTTELGAKEDWSFTVSLPPGVTLDGAATTDCGNAVLTPVGGPPATGLTVTGGDLAAGDASCTIELTVLSDDALAPGTDLTLRGAPAGGQPGPSDLVGLDRPADATLTISGFAPVCRGNMGAQWRFGDSAGLSFLTDPPTATTGPFDTGEGAASIADAAGALLFSSDGSVAYQADGDPMPNGSGLFGNGSSTQSAVIVPRPGFADQYYLVTAQQGHNAPGRVAYSVVDMTLAGGQGDVVVASKNTLLHGTGGIVATLPAEKIAAVPKANGTDAWLVTADKEGTTLYSWSVTAAGISASAAYPLAAPAGDITFSGELDVSPDGTMLAAANVNTGAVHVYAFNDATGAITNKRVITGLSGAYGVEFSPNSELLYAARGGTTTVHQFDLTGPFPTTAADSVATFTASTAGFKAIELGPDGRLYVAQATGDHVAFNGLDVIQYPDEIGVAADYDPLAVTFAAGAASRSGLPNGLTCPVPANQPPSSWTVDLSASSPGPAVPGETITYTVVVTNTGQVPLAGLGVTSDLSGVIDDATYNDDEAFTSPPIGALGLDLDGNVVWTGSLDPGQSVTFTYSVTVRAADDLGDGTLEGELAGTQDPDGPGGPIAPGDGPNLPDGCPSAAGCTSSIPVVAYTVAKVASPGAVNTLTGKVTYVITVENTGAVALAGPTAFEVVDDLSGVLDDAVYNDDAVATAGTASYVAPTLTWTGPLAVDATAVLTYSVDVNVFASLTGGDQVLENVVTTNGAACLAPAPVPADPGCSTLTPYRPFGRPGGGGGGGTTGGGGGGTTGGPGGSTGGPGAPAPAAGSPTGGDGSGITTAGAAGATGHLPTTGSDLSTTMQLALGLVLLGGGIVVLGRWRLRLHVGGP